MSSEGESERTSLFLAILVLVGEKLPLENESSLVYVERSLKVNFHNWNHKV